MKEIFIINQNVFFSSSLTNIRKYIVIVAISKHLMTWKGGKPCWKTTAMAIVFQNNVQKKTIIPDKHKIASESSMLASLQLCQRTHFLILKPKSESYFFVAENILDIT